MGLKKLEEHGTTRFAERINMQIRRNVMLIVLVAIVFVAGTAFGVTASQKDTSKGYERYTPTVLEWIAVRMNASNRTYLTPGGLEAAFIAEYPDTILIKVVYLPDVDRKSMNEFIDLWRRELSVDQKRHPWLKIREDIEQIGYTGKRRLR